MCEQKKLFHLAVLTSCLVSYCTSFWSGGSSSISCPETQVYQQCGSICNRTCEAPVVACRRMCEERCGCPAKTPLWHENRCIKMSECPEKPKENVPEKPIPEDRCPPTQIFLTCGSVCNRTCEHGKRWPLCTRNCMVRCGCPTSRSYWNNGRCITYDECPNQSVATTGYTPTPQPTRDADGKLKTEDGKVANDAKAKVDKSAMMYIIDFLGLS